MIGAGKYDEACTVARKQTAAQGVVLIVLEGALGSGVSVQAPLHMQLAVPGILIEFATTLLRQFQNPEVLLKMAQAAKDAGDAPPTL